MQARENIRDQQDPSELYLDSLLF